MWDPGGCQMPEAPHFLTAAGGRSMLLGAKCSERASEARGESSLGSTSVCLLATTGTYKKLWLD